MVIIKWYIPVASFLTSDFWGNADINFFSVIYSLDEKMKKGNLIVAAKKK